MDPLKGSIMLRFKLYGFLKNLKFFEIFLVLYLIDGGLSFLMIGVLIAVREITANVLEVPTGIVADLMGRRKALMVAFASYILSFLVFFFTHSFWAYVGAMVLFGSGEAFRSGTHKAMIMRYLDLSGIPHLKTRVYGSTRSWSQLGSALSALSAIPMVMLSGGYNILFLFTLAPYIAGMLLVMSYPKVLDREDGTDRAGMISFLRGAFKRIISPGPVRTGILDSGVFQGMFKTSCTYLQPILEAQALMIGVFAIRKEWRIAIVVGLTYALIHVLASQTSRFSFILERMAGGNRWGLDLTYLVNVAVLGTISLSLVYGLYWPVIVLFIGIYSMNNARRPMVVSFLGDHMERKERATVMSVESLFQTLVVATLAPLMGWIADSWGLGGMFMMMSVLALTLGTPLILSRHRA